MLELAFVSYADFTTVGLHHFTALGWGLCCDIANLLSSSLDTEVFTNLHGYILRFKLWLERIMTYEQEKD